jgi:arylformamidase
MTDKRVVFEVEFANGGGVQGQGFRLDIDGDEIDEHALAAYVIRDLRLLMVANARILHKRIVEEPHKRQRRSHRMRGLTYGRRPLHRY